MGWEQELDKEIARQYKKMLQDVANDCRAIFKEVIQENVYQYYTPIPVEQGGYKRTNTLLNNIGVKIEGNTLYVYNDIDKYDYTSAFSDEEVSAYIPMWISGGHHKDGKPQNQFWNYEARNFLEKAKEKVEQKYGFKVEIMYDNEFMG